MRTTLTIDDALYGIARKRAERSGMSIGAVISELAVKGLEIEQVQIGETDDGFPVFEVGDDARSLHSTVVKQAEEEGDEAIIRH